MPTSHSQKQRGYGSTTKKTRGGRRTPHDQLICGIHPILEALKECPQCLKEIYSAKSKPSQRVEEILDLAHKNDIPVRIGSGQTVEYFRNTLEMMDMESSQGLFARIVFPIISFDVFMESLQSVPNPPLLLALDSIQDPHNLGAIIRTAVAAGANGLILPKDRSAAITATVIRVSAGAIFHLKVSRVTNLVSCFKELKKAGIWVFGATKDSNGSIYEVDLTVPACLVIGSEGKGLRPLVAENCDHLISIPMQSSLDSLNASVAAGIILFETVRQRKSN